MSFRKGAVKMLDLEVEMEGGQICVRYPSGMVIREEMRSMPEMLWYLSLLLNARAEQMKKEALQ